MRGPVVLWAILLAGACGSATAQQPAPGSVKQATARQASPSTPSSTTAAEQPPPKAAAPAMEARTKTPVTSPAATSARAGSNAPPPAPHPFQKPLPPLAQLLEGSSMVYANWSPQTCRKKLQQSKLKVRRHRGASKGIATPLRVSEPIGGIKFRAPPASSMFGLMDCRLLFALRDFAGVLAEHNVVEVRIDNYYRVRARLPGRRKRSQHAYGLAADIVSFTLKDGMVLDVEEDYGGRVGDDSCGPTAQLREKTEKALLLRNLICDVARRGIFHHILTPNYNAAHRDHVHVVINRDNRWFSLD